MGLFSRIRVMGAALAGGFMLAAPAGAGIKEYNAAVAAGDFKAAAAETGAVWATYDKTRPEVATIAREFAWTCMRAADSTCAHVFAKFLVEQGATLTKPDDDPLIAKVLLLWSELGDKPSGEARDKLSAALTAWADAKTEVGGRIGAVAASTLYNIAWRDADWRDVERDAKIAETLASRLGAEGIILQQRAILDGAAANFIANHTAEGWLRIADAQDALIDRLPPPRPEKGLDIGDLEPLYWRAWAWRETMSSYFRVGEKRSGFETKYKRQGDLIEARQKTMKSRCGATPCPLTPPLPGEMPRCPAKWDQTPALQYPGKAEFRGLIGTTILHLAVDEAGHVQSVKILAAVPSDVFPEATVAAVKKWTLKRAADAQAGCTLGGERNLIVRFIMP